MKMDTMQRSIQSMIGAVMAQPVGYHGSVFGTCGS